MTGTTLKAAWVLLGGRDMRWRTLVFVLFIGLVSSAPAHALTIIGNYSATFTGPDNSAANGGGNIQDVFDAAARYWELMILDEATVVIPFGWVPGASFLGVYDGTGILFPSGHDWFVDATPEINEEYTTPHVVNTSLDGTPINYAVGFTGGFGAADGYDLFTVMLHEIGHALTFANGQTAPLTDYADGDVDVTAPRPLAGLQIPVANFCCHVGTPAGYTGMNPLLFPTMNSGERRLIADVDLLFVAQGGGWRVLDPTRFATA